MIQCFNPAPCFILTHRNQYASCHIRVPDVEGSLAAIRFGEHYYSFLRAATDSRKILGIAVKLNYAADPVAITRTSKGYAVWVQEPESYHAQLTKRLFQDGIPHEPAFCKILVSQQQYHYLNIWLPDQKQVFPAFVFEEKYYSIVKVEAKATKILELVAQLTQNGCETVITKVETGYAICKRENEAQPV